MDQPRLHGVYLPRPSTHTRVPVPVASTTALASGAEAAYHQGHRLVFELSWDAQPDTVAAAVERLGMLVGPVEYVDLDGTVYVVTVSDVQPRTARAGTDPVRYDVGLTLQEHTPRVVPPPAPDPTPGGGGGGTGGGYQVDPNDPTVLLVYGQSDPNEPGVVVLGG